MRKIAQSLMIQLNTKVNDERDDDTQMCIYVRVGNIFYLEDNCYLNEQLYSQTCLVLFDTYKSRKSY